MSEEISKSKKKRLAIKEERAKAKKQKALRTFLMIIIPLAIIAAIVGIVLYQRKIAKENYFDYSAYFTETGTIKDINIDEYITFDYQNMSFSRSALMPSEEQIDADIESIRQTYRTLGVDQTTTSKDGDTVNIYYKSTVDGVSYNEVNADSNGLDIKIGDAIFSEEFDQALIGHKSGDTFQTSVTYPADSLYTDIAGKTVVYDITFNGIYNIPEFNDAFVKEHLADRASTAAEYKEVIKNEYFEENLSREIDNSLSANYVIQKLPEEFVANQEKGIRKTMESYLEYYNQYYVAMGIASPITNLLDLYGFTSEEELNAMIHEEAVVETETILAYQYIFVHEGLANTPEQVKANYLKNGGSEEEYNSNLSQYGFNSIANSSMMDIAKDYLIKNVKITD